VNDMKERKSNEKRCLLSPDIYTPFDKISYLVIIYIVHKRSCSNLNKCKVIFSLNNIHRGLPLNVAIHPSFP